MRLAQKLTVTLEGQVRIDLESVSKSVGLQCLDNGDSFPKMVQTTTASGRNDHLQPEHFGPRTWRHNLRLLHFENDWRALGRFYRDTGAALLAPPILWLLLLNGAFLGVYVYQASTFAPILMAPPYLFQFEWLGFVQLAQVVDVAVMLPFLGWGSDVTVRLMSRLKGGTFEPEYRLLPLVLPAIAAVVGCIIYGRAGASPEQWSWAAVPVAYNLGYFAFLGANMVGITYIADAFPRQAGPMLLAVCAGRGFISFGLSFSTVPFVATSGYDGAMNVFAIICGILSGLGVIVYATGKAVRRWADRSVFRLDG